MSEAASWRTRLRRWRWWIGAAIAVIALRIALPTIVRHVIVSQATQALRAEVELGDVDLFLWRGGVVLEDFALLPLAEPLPPEAEPSPAPGDAATPTSVDRRPIVAWKRLAVGLRYWPLREKTVRLYELTLESPRLAVDRLESGDFNVLLLLPSPTPGAPDGSAAAAGTGTALNASATPPPDSTPTASPEDSPAAAQTPGPETGAPAADEGGWLVGIDKLVIADGKGVFRDYMVAGSEPVELGLPTIEVRDLAFDPKVYGGPAEARIKLVLDEGYVELGAKARLAGEAMALEADLKAEGLPLRRSRVYVPEVGWSELQGRLDAALTYELETGAKNLVRGSVTLRDVAVIVPDVPDALSWKKLTVEVDPLDLLGASVVVKSMELDGAILTVHPESGELPVLARPLTKDAAGAVAEGTPPPTPPTPATEVDADPEAGEKPAPWRWAVSSLRLNGSAVKLAGSVPLDVAVAVAVQNLSDEPGNTAAVHLDLRPGSGSLVVEGEARLEPPGFGGTVKLEEIAVPELIRASGAVPDSPLQSAQLSATLDVAAGMKSATSGEVGATDLRIAGKLAIAAPKLTLPASGGDPATSASSADLGIEAESLSVVLGHLDLPAILDTTKAERTIDVRIEGAEVGLEKPRLALGDGKQLAFSARRLRATAPKLELPQLVAPAGAPPLPITAALDEIVIEAPVLQLTRTAEGLVMPGSKASSGNAPAPEVTEPAATESPAAEEAAAPAPPGVLVTLGSLSLKDGRVDVDDRAVSPPLELALRSVNLEVRDLRFPELAIRDVRFRALTPGNGEIEVEGSLASAGTKIKADVRKLDLPTFNSYATTYSPFRISGGAATVSATIAIAGERYDITSNITLHQLGLAGKGGESLFEKEFGVPLSTALALMRDAAGDIALDIPVQMDAEGTTIDIWAIAGGALRRALLNALTSPLRLLGAVGGSGDRVEIAPAAITFAAGRADLAEDDRKRVEQLGAFLASRPALGVKLETANTQIDARWLREQALRRDWESQGFFESLLSLGQGDVRGRIQAALEARAGGRTAELSSEDEHLLEEWLAEIPAVTAEELTTLSSDRLSKVQSTLRGHTGVAPGQAEVLPVSAEIGDGVPEAKIVLEPIAGAEESAGRP